MRRMDPELERSMRTLTDEQMKDLMRKSNKTAFEAWREVLTFVEMNEDTQKVIKRVDRAVKRATKNLMAKCTVSLTQEQMETVILEDYAYVGKAINESTMELAYYYFELEDWETFTRIILTNNYAKQITFDYLFDRIPDEWKYDLIVGAYKWGAANLRSVQEMIRKLPAYGKPELPEDFEDDLTVYRGCVGDAAKAARSYSWTINLEVARYFRRAQEGFYKDKAHIYRGKIQKNDIAAYIPELGQAEVVQLGKVYDVEDITDQVAR